MWCCGLIPRPPHLRREVRIPRHEEQRIRRPQIGDRHPVELLAHVPDAGPSTGNTSATWASRVDRCDTDRNAEGRRSRRPRTPARTGSAIPKLYTSKIPPRTLNCATSSTIGTRSNPIPSRCVANSSGRRRVALAGARGARRRPPAAAACAPAPRARSSAARAPRHWRSAPTSPRARPPPPRAARLPRIPPAAGTTPRARSPVSDCRSANHRSASGNPSVTTTMNRPGNRRASAATVTASPDPANPATVKRPPGPGSVLINRVNAGRRSTASSSSGRATVSSCGNGDA